MSEPLLQPGERLDDLIIGGMKLIQHPEEFCFSLDAVLLAQFATVRRDARVIDLGTGTGVVALLVAQRGAAHVTGLEISPVMAERASRSVVYNQLQERVQIMAGDLRDIRQLQPAGEFDLVVSNPPYRPVQGGYISPNDLVARARHEVTANLQDVVAAAAYLVKYRGRFAMVHLPERLSEIMNAMQAHGLEPKRLQLVQAGPSRKPNMALIEGIRGAKPGLDVLPALHVYQPDGSYSPEIQAYYAGW